MESHAESRAVDVWGTKSAFDQTTVSPRAIVSVGGSNPKFLIVTVCARGAGLVHAATTPRATTDAVAAQRTGKGTLRRLNLLRHFEVGRDGRADLHEQRLEVGVLRVRDERLVDRVQHGLMVGHLVVDVRLVELLAAQALKLREIAVATGLELLAGVVVLGRDVELGG